MTTSPRDTVKYAAVLRALRMGCTVASAAVLVLLWSWLLDMVERAETEAFAHVRIIAEERARSVADAMQTSIERLDFALLTVRHIGQTREAKTEWDRFVVDSLGVQGVQIARIDANGYAASFSRNAFLRGYVGNRGFFSALKTLPGDPLLIDTPSLEQGGDRQQAWTIPFSRKARVSGPFSGTITLLVPAGIWQAQFAQYLGAEHDAIAVLSSDGGKYILRLPDPDSAHGRYTPSEWPALFRRETDDHGHFVGRGTNDNLERLIAWVRLPSGPIAAAGIAFDDVLAPARALERALKIGGGIFSVLVVLLAGSLAAALTIAEKSLRVRDEREIFYRNLTDNMAQGVMEFDADGRILRVNAAFSAITGYTPENALGKSPGMLSPTHGEARNLGKMIEQWIEEGGNAAGEGDFDGLRAHGATRPFTGHALLMAHTGTDACRIVLISDVSAERRERTEVWRAANFDTLTGLANRELMHDHLELMTNHALVQHDCGAAVLFIGLDYFVPASIRNNSDITMRLCYEIAHRLRGIFHAEDTIACLRDDRFVVLLPDYGSASVAERAAARVVGSLSGGFAVDEDAQVEITCHVGVARLPDNGKTSGELLHSAEQAMLRAREKGRSCWSV
ncbi:MAG: diguanylate cyclase [Azoarcus sp.]|jgi:diguanylate cyclase (GGDEF)-like protein/PAS domain S-box-containing protein|nr:diguanylate cyclase [Azoarcus sp.]